MAGLSGRRFPDPVLLFPLCGSYHPYPLYPPDRIQHQMCCRNGRYQGKRTGTPHSPHRDDSADLFQFPLRLPSEQHPCRSRWSQRVPCQHLAAHLYPNVYQEDRKKERAGSLPQWFRNCQLGIRHQHLRLRIRLPLVLRIRCMGIWRLDFCRLHCQYHDGRHLLSPCRPDHPILPPHAHQESLLLRFPDDLHLSWHRQTGCPTDGSGKDTGCRLRILFRQLQQGDAHRRERRESEPVHEVLL